MADEQVPSRAASGSASSVADEEPAARAAVDRSAAAKRPPHKTRRNALSDGQGRLAGLLLSPTMLVILFIVGIPILLSMRESVFRQLDAVDPRTGKVVGGDQFVGLGNYTDVFSNTAQLVTTQWGTHDRFTNALINTTLFTVICVLIETVLGVAMALIMARAIRGTGLIRAGILVPWAIPTIVSALMWKLIFDSDGVANKILGQQILWLADGPQSFLAVIIADVWKTAPFIGLLTLAGLQTIPAEVYEAAKVDGASPWQTFVRITLPMVKPALVVAVLFRALDTLRMFDLPWGMIGSGKYSVETMSMFAYIESNATRYGPAAAYSIVLFLYIMLIAFVFVRVLGADVVGDEELNAIKEQKKRHRQQKRTGARNGSTRSTGATITSGDMP
ncbi:multiple sugar transport system permease protein [Naumannella cuiyingiana]|uniref:Multiple sugar transport system permease protein n=1 Tax=Naumannella cuiyingiana TaxID=1347891 RepID=A0A7Z0D771_9ACTN|nr:sugar ABC transporter permease [Naumannella cuiyingiana]NYI70151.1 multiple sugar transport system permease protein [Naumannella cuiyingiana]